MDANIKARIEEWLTPLYDEETRNEIRSLLDSGNEKELEDRFYTNLEFGTGGLRGTIGAGTNRMNIYTVRMATQGLANYIIRKGGKEKGVVIGRDSRLFSDRFAMESANVLVANGIKVYFFNDIHPTPLVSYAVRKLNAIAGIMITASHNPKQYNGYKVFWSDGGQVVPPEDKEIIEEVKKIASIKDVKVISFEETKKSGLYKEIDEEIDPSYLQESKSLSMNYDINLQSDIKICYTPLYGTGYKLIPESLKNFGFKNIFIVKEQSIPDGNFPLAPYPNPEIPEAMEVGMKYAKEMKADVLLASDPDADRIGVMIRKDNDYLLLNGNQIGCLLLYYILSGLKEKGQLSEKGRVVTTIVSTRLLLKIAEGFNIKVDEVLTGFKWIAEKIRKYEKTNEHFIFGCEESHGYLVGTFVRDKDAVIASSLFAELTAYYKSKGKSVADVLDEIYIKFGYFKESQKSIEVKGKEGLDKIKATMENLRKSPPEKISDFKLLQVYDLKNKRAFDLVEKREITPMDLPSSDVIVMKFSNDCEIIGRPSGTEPKIKFYFSNFKKISDGQKLDDLKKDVENIHNRLKEDFLKFLNF
ncbi:MAG: phospho-sugar mutase [Brevinematales bacterium]|nr:phospho-sugar mutase [Brevinematales bacterium]